MTNSCYIKALASLEVGCWLVEGGMLTGSDQEKGIGDGDWPT